MKVEDADELKVSTRFLIIVRTFCFSDTHIEEYLTAAGIGFDSYTDVHVDDDNEEPDLILLLFPRRPLLSNTFNRVIFIFSFFCVAKCFRNFSN